MRLRPGRRLIGGTTPPAVVGRWQPADSGEEPPGAGRVLPVRIAVGPQQVRLLDEAHPDYWESAIPTSIGTAKTFGTTRATPAAVRSVEVRIGF